MRLIANDFVRIRTDTYGFNDRSEWKGLGSRCYWKDRRFPGDGHAYKWQTKAIFKNVKSTRARASLVLNLITSCLADAEYMGTETMPQRRLFKRIVQLQQIIALLSVDQ